MHNHNDTVADGIMHQLSHLKFLGIKEMFKNKDSLILHPFRSISPSLPPVQQPKRERERERKREREGKRELLRSVALKSRLTSLGHLSSFLSFSFSWAWGYSLPSAQSGPDQKSHSGVRISVCIDVTHVHVAVVHVHVYTHPLYWNSVATDWALMKDLQC